MDTNPVLAASRNLLGLGLEELEEFALVARQPRYRGRQLYHGLYARRQSDFDALTDLDRPFRDFLRLNCTLLSPEIEQAFGSRDGSIRYLLRLQDGEEIEAVYMPPVAPVAEERRVTLCISSQVGCAVDCRFCFTGLLGLKRNLEAGEIVGQVLTLVRTHNVPRQARLNVVFMGMGEPLLNFSPVMKAVALLADPAGVGIPWRRITLSTSGVIPQIEKLAQEPVRPKLAVSLNASDDEQRTALMPVNRKYPLPDLLRVCREYPLRPRERLTFEYVLLDGANDTVEDARRVADLVRGIRCKVNLIPYNGGPALPYRPTPLHRVLAFQRVLAERGLPAFIRISRGQDVAAACGQLRLEQNTSNLQNHHFLSSFPARMTQTSRRGGLLE